MMDWLLSNLWYAFSLMALIVAAIAIVAPFESLKWWSADMELHLPDVPERKAGEIPKDECFVVYLTGIGGSGRMPRRQARSMSVTIAKTPQRQVGQVFEMLAHHPVEGGEGIVVHREHIAHERGPALVESGRIGPGIEQGEACWRGVRAPMRRGCHEVMIALAGAQRAVDENLMHRYAKRGMMQVC